MVQTKCSNDDFQYYRKEVGFKMDRSEMESVR